MTQKLRRRFILIATQAFAAVLLLTLLAVNLVHLSNVYRSLDNRLDYLAGSRLGPTRGMLAMLPEEIQNWVDVEADGIMQEDYYFIFSGYMREDQRLRELESLSASAGEDAGAFLDALVSGDRERGNFGSYRYYMVQGGSLNYKVVFLSAEKEFFSIRSLLKSSVLVGLACFALVFLLVALMSGPAVKPFVENIERQKRFITDASHQIKTPLGIIAADVDILAMEQGDSEWTQSARGQIDLLADLADGLVILSQLEESVTPPEIAPFRPQDRLVALLDSFTPQILEKNIRLEKELRFPGELLDDGTSFEHLAQILLENAVKYTPPGGYIQVLLRRERKGCLLQVINDCETPEEIDTERIFQRFYRTDSARAQSPGHGIGLSIARNIAENRGWKLSARCSDRQITFRAEI